MRNRLYFSVLALTVLAPAWMLAEDRSLILVIGPNSEARGALAAHNTADAVAQWLKAPGAAASVWRPGAGQAQELTKFMSAGDLEKTFLDAAHAGRESPLAPFLGTLDKSGYALSRRPGKRVLIAIVENAPLTVADADKGGPAEVENRLSQTMDFCKENSINVIVLDPSLPSAKDSLAALTALAAGTGGALVRDPEALSAQVQTIVPVEKAAEPTLVQQGAAPPAGPIVHARFIRTLPRALPGTELGPTHGMLIAESPLSTVEFQKDGKTYQAHVRFTQTVRNAEGKTVWQASKEMTVKGPIQKLDARRAGSLYYVRDVQLPAGQYKIEASVEDLIGGQTGNDSKSLTATSTVPGFDVSDAMLIRKTNDAGDKFDGDEVLSFDGKAFSPLIDPVFPANQPLELQLYVIIYPDLRGGQPSLDLDILHDGQVVGHSQLRFADQIRNTATEGGALDAKGDQKNEFPYIGRILDAMFSAGEYEARLTVRQDRNTVTRVAPFRVQ